MKKEYCENVSLEVSDEIAVVALTNPSKRNALSVKVLTALIRACADISVSSVKAVILKGEGPSFCTGLDIKSAVANPFNFRRLLRTASGRSENLAQRAILCWTTLPIPVFSAIQGHCLGGGLQLALATDFRFATPDCKFSLLEAKWGLIPDMGVSALLPKELPIDKAKELAMTGRIFDGLEALELGLIAGLSENPYETCIERAVSFAGSQPPTVFEKLNLFDSNWLAGAPEVLRQ